LGIQIWPLKYIDLYNKNANDIKYITSFKQISSYKTELISKGIFVSAQDEVRGLKDTGIHISKHRCYLHEVPRRFQRSQPPTPWIQYHTIRLLEGNSFAPPNRSTEPPERRSRAAQGDRIGWFPSAAQLRCWLPYQRW